MRALALVFIASLVACAKSEAPSGKALSCAASDGGEVAVSNAWVRAQGDRTGTSAAYFALCNGSMAPVTLTGLETGLADRVEFHETTRDANGVVSMSPIGEVTLAPGELVVFEPGGRHAMLMDLKDDIDADDDGRLTFTFADGSSVSVKADARSAADAAEHKVH